MNTSARSLLAIASLVALASCKPTAAQRTQARSLSKAAFARLQDHPFELDSVALSANQLGAAAKLSPDEAWVHIGNGQLALTTGHDMGSWYRMERFNPAAVESARKEAALAIASDSLEPQAWCSSALIHILDKRWDLVQGEVNRAYQIDTSAFEPYHLRGVAYRMVKQYDKSRQFYLLADSHATTAGQRKQVIAGLSAVAKGQGDHAEELRLLMKDVQSDPTNAWSCGMVAEWYMTQKRYAEAVQWWEKTVAIAPFGRAVAQLAKAREAVRTGVAPAQGD